MKKKLCIVLALCMLLLVACESKPAENNEVNDDRINPKIVEGTEFSEGLAFVQYEGSEHVVHCIDKEGHVQFTLNEKLYDLVSDGFVNGYVDFDENIYDKTGKLVDPAAVGVENLYSNALEDGYFIALKETYSGQQMGVMDTNLQWVVEPTEELYELFTNDCDWDTCYAGYVYMPERASYLELATGNICEESVVDAKITAYHWIKKGSIYYHPLHQDRVMLDVSEQENLHYVGLFVEGYAPMMFVNNTAYKYYLTLIDHEGNMQFEPKYVGDFGMHYIDFDGENVVLRESRKDADYFLSYDKNGNKLGEMKTESSWCDINEGVIMIRDESNTPKYYSLQFEPLF